ncbi:MAG: hypothetical protein Q7T82_20445 [Armatimonadota bacterium]|nr:hypothetical protein [Armatimonadota bacterium]
MNIELPDVASIAAKIIERARDERDQFIDGPVDRVMADSPWADRETLFSGLIDFHRERLDRIPSAAKYPEAQPWVEHRLALERELVAAGLSEWDRAVLGGLNDYLSFRGFRLAAKKRRGRSTGTPGSGLVEKCRVAFLPETDEGPVLIKNVDDPATFWRKDRTSERFVSGFASFSQPVRLAGVGSGLHLDVEPEEIFPLPVLEMCAHFCQDTPSTVEFLTRYCSFYSGVNYLILDRERRSAMVEKCSRCHVEVFYPTVHGRSHVSGMVCRDPDSAPARHQRAMREEYLALAGSRWDAKESVDVAFWEACDLAERILADFLDDPKPITVEALQTLFTTPFPRGLRKDGAKFHPSQPHIEYTLVTWMVLLEKRRLIRFQCDDPPAMTWPEEPEVYQVSDTA